MSQAVPTPAAASNEKAISRAVCRFRGVGGLVTQLFGHARDSALRVRCYGSLVYLLPWRSSGHRLAAYVVPRLDDPRPVPIELSPGRVNAIVEHGPTVEEPLWCTPIWLVDVDDDLEVSWHARCRYAQRVEALTDPGPRIRELYREAVSPSGAGSIRYHPGAQLVIAYSTRRGPAPTKITTVYPADDPSEFEGQHLKRCADCELLVDPGKGHGTTAETCPWCSSATNHH